MIKTCRFKHFQNYRNFKWSSKAANHPDCTNSIENGVNERRELSSFFEAVSLHVLAVEQVLQVEVELNLEYVGIVKDVEDWDKFHPGHC